MSTSLTRSARGDCWFVVWLSSRRSRNNPRAMRSQIAKTPASFRRAHVLWGAGALWGADAALRGSSRRTATGPVPVGVAKTT